MAPSLDKEQTEDADALFHSLRAAGEKMSRDEVRTRFALGELTGAPMSKLSPCAPTCRRCNGRWEVAPPCFGRCSRSFLSSSFEQVIRPGIIAKQVWHHMR
jgi:hypothetical protein